MSDIETLVKAVADGKYSEADDAFSNVMASKVSDRLDAMKVDVAQNMFRNESSEVEAEQAVELEEPEIEQAEEVSEDDEV